MHLKKVLVTLLILLFLLPLGCQTSNQTDRALIDEIEKMQQEIDELKKEVKSVEKKQETVIQVPVQTSCSLCTGLGHINCVYCKGTGNSNLACYMCDGTGLDGSFACYRCKGTGFGKCIVCTGSGRVTCSNCGGSGVY